MNDEIERMHREACERGETSYRDPQTGYIVITETGHIKRGSCCGCDCRHCPWRDTINTPDNKSNIE